MKKGLLSRLAIVAVSTLSLAGSIAAFSIAWFTLPGGSTNKETLDGEVGLRNYFYDGNGSESKPFEIVSPIHFYNLTRLQNLGVFSQKKYFQIGHDFNGTYGCLDDNGNVVQYLDMGAFSTNATVLPIGGEGAPFVGTFDGKGIPVKNLKVQGYPEDIGVFGYVSYEGSVTGLVCDTLEIHSMGYTNDPEDYSTQLFGQEIDDIFDAHADYLATKTSVNFIDYNSDGEKRHGLKNYNDIGSYSVSQANNPNKLISNDSTVYNGYFEPIFPTDEPNDPFTYSWRSSSSLIQAKEIQTLDGTTKSMPVIDFKSLADSGSDVEKHEFNCGEQMQVDARLSLIASVEIGGFTYSRVIQTYKVEFLSNGSTYENGQYAFHIYCDYLDRGRLNDKPTNYHHGNNIGFLAGHVDGSITNSYVYKGKLILNDNGNCHEIPTESESGLIGEIGTNVVNSFDPDYGLTKHGDTGIINFTKIYGKIRGDVVQGETTMAGKHTFSDWLNNNNVVDRYYLSYNAYKNSDTATYNLFKPYLRKFTDVNETVITGVTNPGGNNSIDSYSDGNLKWHSHQMNTIKSDFNSVDFIWNSVIQDDLPNDEDRGLGVFKIVSNYMDTSVPGFEYGERFLDGLGDCRIMNGKDYTKVYFSTCEYDHTVTNNITSWNPLRPTTLPSYSDEKSFKYPFSRDYNYCFELDLSQMDFSGGKNYMHNTDSKFLANYLKSKLIDKYGGSIEYGNPRFGFMFRNSEYETVRSLSSYMPLGKPGDKANFGTSQNPEIYPRKSIVFDIENENGANVSVIGGGNDLSIYSYDPSTLEGGVNKIYTMKCARDNTTDTMRYFKYTLSSGETSGHTTDIIEENGDSMKNSDYLYAHIFKLPKGHYVLGAANDNAIANVYFLCVQGQTDANIGDNTQASIGSAVTDVDFLLEPPTYADYPNSLKFAEFSFKSNYNLMLNKIFEVNVTEQNSKKYLNLLFQRNPDFVTYLLLIHRGEDPKYYINNVAYTNGTYVYIQP